MLEVYDRSRKKQAVLHLAHDRKETRTLNGVFAYEFTLPGDDPKAGFCQPFCFVREAGGDYYRIMDDTETVTEIGERRYTAEHAIATLVDDIMFGTHLYGSQAVTTRQVIEYILSFQSERRWVLDVCDFDLQYEYGFESENLLNALFSVPNLFADPYQWTYDMSVYPWRLSLRRLSASATPQFCIRAGKNLLSAERKTVSTGICTRLYLLGYGEGVNQLTIKEVNGGLPYLQSPKAYTDKYGIISKVYVDRQFEDATSLLGRGQALLKEMQEPQYARTFDVVDLYELTTDDLDRAEPGRVAMLAEDGTCAFITKVTRNLDVAGDMSIELSTTATDLAADIADLADRQRIEQVYSQGATQIYAQSIQANADSKTPAVLNFYIPPEMRIVNKVLAKISLDRFRSYSRSTRADGSVATTSGGGGASTATSSSGGGSATSSGAAGESTRTSSASAKASVTSGPSSKATVTQSRLVTEDSTARTTQNVTLYAYASGMTTTTSGSGGGGNTGAYSGYTGSGGGGGTGYAGSGSTGSATSSTSSVYIGSSGGYHSHTVYGHYHSIGSHAHSIGSHLHLIPAHTHTTAAHTHGIAHTHNMGAHAHIMTHAHYYSHSHNIDHTHTVTVPSHTHTVSVPAHTHSVSIPAHTHSVSIPSHTHTVNIPAHAHEVEQGIFRFGSPKSARIQVNGADKLTMSTEREVDLTEYLLNSSGKIPRGSWIRLGVLPDDLAYITIDIFVQGFVQSRGGSTY